MQDPELYVWIVSKRHVCALEIHPQRIKYFKVLLLAYSLTNANWPVVNHLLYFIVHKILL